MFGSKRIDEVESKVNNLQAQIDQWIKDTNLWRDTLQQQIDDFITANGKVTKVKPRKRSS